MTVLWEGYLWWPGTLWVNNPTQAKSRLEWGTLTFVGLFSHRVPG
jgi:hypothetical protein